MPFVEISLLEFKGKSGNFLTFVVGRTCPLTCAFCVVHQRGEIIDEQLQPGDIAEFIRQVCDKSHVLSLSIVGYEPLSLGAIPYCRAIFAAAKERSLPCSLVTNGLELEEFVETLAGWAPNSVVVSLDSALPEVHDAIRGLKGAWWRTVRGINSALSKCELAGKISVASVLTPRDRGMLHLMPALLASLGVRDWRINLLQRVGRGVQGGPVYNSSALPSALNELNSIAADNGINLSVDDELAAIREEMRRKMPSVRFRQKGPHQNIIRLSSSGFCSVNGGTLVKESVNGPRWTPSWGDAAQFVRKISENDLSSLEVVLG